MYPRFGITDIGSNVKASISILAKVQEGGGRRNGSEYVYVVNISNFKFLNTL
jgi:hypothetical protein